MPGGESSDLGLTDHTIIQVYRGDRDLCTNLPEDCCLMSFGVHKPENRPIEIVSEKTQHRAKMINVSGVAFQSGEAKLRYGRYRRSKESALPMSRLQNFYGLILPPL